MSNDLVVPEAVVRSRRREEASGRSGPGSGWRFWVTAYTLLILLAGTNLPTPLYRSYEERFGFSPFVVTLIFAVYVAVLIPALLVAGPISDDAGCSCPPSRRRVSGRWGSRSRRMCGGCSPLAYCRVWPLVRHRVR
jgi:hypothetical protein